MLFLLSPLQKQNSNLVVRTVTGNRAGECQSEVRGNVVLQPVMLFCLQIF